MGHKWQAPSWVWNGHNATAEHTCTLCGETETLSAAVTSEVTTAATCTEEGVRTYTATLTTGDADSVTEAIPATGHSWKPTYTWSSDYSRCTATFTCKVCEETQGPIGGRVTKKQRRIDGKITKKTGAVSLLTDYIAELNFDGRYYETKTAKIGLFGSVFGNGSLIAVISGFGVAAAAAVVIVIWKKRKKEDAE